MINTFDKEFTYTVNSGLSCDVLVQDISSDPTQYPSAAFRQIVLIIPWSDSSTQLRLATRPYRAHYGANKTIVVDVDQTFPARQNLIDRGEPLDTANLVREIFAINGIAATEIVL